MAVHLDFGGRGGAGGAGLKLTVVEFRLPIESKVPFLGGVFPEVAGTRVDSLMRPGCGCCFLSLIGYLVSVSRLLAVVRGLVCGLQR